jgi:Transporter associated domain
MVRAITHLTWLRFNRRSLEMRFLWYPEEFLIISAKNTFATISALSGGLECDGARSRRYGQFEGLVTNADILEAIAGAFRTEEGAAEPEAVQRDDGSWLISGSMPADEIADRLSISLPPDRSYHTAAGFVLSQLGHLPEVGETFDRHSWRFEVVDLDGRRIDKILASRIPAGRRRRAA